MVVKFAKNEEVIVQFRFDKPKETESEDYGKGHIWGIIKDGEEEIINVSAGLLKKLNELGVKRGDKVSIKKITYTNDEGEPRAGWEVKKLGTSASAKQSSGVKNDTNGVSRYTDEEIFAFNVKDALSHAVQLMSAKTQHGGTQGSIAEMVGKIEITAELLFRLHKDLEQKLKSKALPKRQEEPKPPEEIKPPDETGEAMPPLEEEDYPEDVGSADSVPF